jgi:signal transduction histidine kinase/CheY-like chemotaxis protein
MGGEINFNYADRKPKKKEDPKELLYKALINVSVLIMGIDQTESKLIFWNALKMLGVPLGAATFAVWRNFDSAEQLYCERIASWTANRPLFRTPEADNIPTSTVNPNWKHKNFVAAEQRLLADDLPEHVREFFSPDSYNSLYIIPITYHSEFWGMISLAFTDPDRVLAKSETEVLHSAGLLFAAATARKDILRNLYEAKEAALASVKSKAEFLSRMSHEMRTPLNAINGMVSIAEGSNDPEKTAQCLERIGGASNQLLAIINDVLDMSKIDTDTLEIHKTDTDLEDLLANVYKIYEEKAFKKNISLRFKMGRLLSRHIIADPLRVTQVLQNILSNAIKFTPDGGTVSLFADVLFEDDRQVISVQISDTGIGISEQNIPLLFGAFEQADGGITRRFGGTGLGLSISKNLVALMGGRIWAESELGEGSVFTVILPAEWGKSIDFGTDISRLNVTALIITENEAEADYLDETLHNCGFFTAVEKTVSGALTHAIENFAIIFINKEIVKHSRDAEIKKLIDTYGAHRFTVTARRAFDPEEEKNLSQKGFVDIFERPVLPARVVKAILTKTGRTVAAPAKVSAYRPRNWSGKRLLLAEDLEINRMIVSGILEETGIEIIEAKNGVEAIELFQKDGPFDVILMDINMPIMDGISAVKRIRASELPGAETIPIYALTANAFAADVKNCMDAGMNGHIAKPIDVDSFKEIIEQCL